MSIDYGIYVGPYVRCKVDQAPVTRLQITCPNDACKNHKQPMRKPFCDLCGSKVATVPLTVMEDRIDTWDVREAIDERLCTASGDTYGRWSEENRTHLWKPNKQLGMVAGHLESREAFALFTIEPSVIGVEIARFQGAFSDDIEYLQTVYGADAVSIEWGIIQDYS